MALSVSITDMGTTELDKLIHNFEFENQQFVKLIEKENQLIKVLQAQIQEKNDQTNKLEDEVSGFDQETKRLHRQYTNNRDNISNLKSTRNVMSDHELALSKQLECLKVRTEEDSKYYKDHMFNYSSIRDDYIKKYRAFPMALALEREKFDLATFQKTIDEIEMVKDKLKEEIGIIEDELGSKVMTRIVVKIAKTNLEMTQLEKDIHGSLTEKTILLEKLKDIQECKQSETVTFKGFEKNLGEHDSSNKFGQQNNMDVDELASEDDSSNGKENNTSIDNETFARMSIQDDCHLAKDKQDLLFNEMPDMREGSLSDLPDKGSIYSSKDGDQEMSEDAAFLEKECFTKDNLPRFERNTMMSSLDMPVMNSEIESMAVPGASGHQAQELKKNTESAKAAASNGNSSRTASVMNAQKYSGTQQSVQHLSGGVLPKSTPVIGRRDARKPPSICLPAFNIPKPPRIPPPPASRSSIPLEGQQTLASSEMEQPLLPPPPSKIKHGYFERENIQQSQSVLYSAPLQQLQQTDTLPTGTASTVRQVSNMKNNSDSQMHQPLIRKDMSIRNPVMFNQDGLVGKGKSQAKHVSKESVDNPAKEIKDQPLSDSSGSSNKESTSASTAQIPVTPKARKICETARKENNNQSASKLANINDNQADKIGTTFPKTKSLAPIDVFETYSEKLCRSPVCEYFEDLKDEDDTAPDSVFTLFNAGQTAEESNEESCNESISFAFGKFIDDSGSPGTEEAPSNLLNLFCKTQESLDSPGFALSFDMEKDEEDMETRSSDSLFKLGDQNTGCSFFSFKNDGNDNSDESQGERLFNLF